MTPPAVQLDPPKVGTGASAGKVAISWRASDPHLAARPVVLSYRPDRPDAIWQQVTPPLENTGQFVWTVPAGIPPRFHLRIDVFDTLGNRGSAETTDSGPVIVDRTRPRGRILGLDPVAPQRPRRRPSAHPCARRRIDDGAPRRARKVAKMHDLLHDAFVAPIGPWHDSIDRAGRWSL
jgi:hypothetical protein